MHLPENRGRTRTGETFEYRGYDCRISYNGIRPYFTIDGENAEHIIPSFTVTPESVGASDWDYALMEAIDRFEGEDTDAADYLSPKQRLVMRTFGHRMMDTLATEAGSYRAAHEVITTASCSWDDVRDRAFDRQRELLLSDDEDIGAIEAIDEARLHVAQQLLEEV